MLRTNSLTKIQPGVASDEIGESKAIDKLAKVKNHQKNHQRPKNW